MKQILLKYKEIMNSGKISLENLQLKKIRYHHPIFRDMSYNAFKMIFDLCEIVQIKKGDKLFKQDSHISDFYFVMHGRLELTYYGAHEELECNKDGGFLGLTLGEEMLFYEEPLYRETAVCATPTCCALQIRAEIMLELGDDNFNSKGLGAEAFKKDMDLLFERISHIYNKKERWRLMIAAKESQAIKGNDKQYTQFVKSF